MKNLFILLLVAVGLSSCSKTEVYNVTVENVTVNLNSKELLETVVKPFGKLASTGGEPVTDDYDHHFPSTYKAYFVSKETRGEYMENEVIKIIDVKSGDNEITIPKLNYTVYVTNYEKDELPYTKFAWYTYPDALEQLPRTSHQLYLWGKSDIDYSEVESGTVELINPYAAVMIRNNNWVNGFPKSYDTQQNYLLTSNQVWYIIYTRGNNTNTKVPLKIREDLTKQLTLSYDIVPNQIYQYTIISPVDNTSEANLGITVKGFSQIIQQDIKF